MYIAQGRERGAYVAAKAKAKAKEREREKAKVKSIPEEVIEYHVKRGTYQQTPSSTHPPASSAGPSTQTGTKGHIAGEPDLQTEGQNQSQDHKPDPGPSPKMK